MLLVAHDVNPILGYLDRVVYLAGGGAVEGAPREVITSETLEPALRRADRGAARPSDGRLVVVGQPEAPSVHGDRHAHDRRALGRRSSLEPGRRRPAAASRTTFMVNALEAGTIVAVHGRRDRLVHGAAPADLRRPHPVGDRASPARPARAWPGVPVVARLLRLLRARRAGASPASPARRRGSLQRGVGGDRHVQAFALACGFLFVSLYHGSSNGLERAAVRHLPRHHRRPGAGAAGRRPPAVLVVLAGDRPAAAVRLGRPRRRRGRRRAGARCSLGFLLLLGLAVAATSQITGALLVFALLVTPAATAQPADRAAGARARCSSVAIALARHLARARRSPTSRSTRSASASRSLAFGALRRSSASAASPQPPTTALGSRSAA